MEGFEGRRQPTQRDEGDPSSTTAVVPTNVHVQLYDATKCANPVEPPTLATTEVTTRTYESKDYYGCNEQGRILTASLAARLTSTLESPNLVIVPWGLPGRPTKHDLKSPDFLGVSSRFVSMNKTLIRLRSVCFAFPHPCKESPWAAIRNFLNYPRDWSDG